MSKETFYFSHDYNARNDEKIKDLIFKHGMQGYGVYWSIIEDLYQNTNVLHLNCDRISFELRVEYEIVRSVIYDFDLFDIKDENFSSLSVQKRLDERKSKSEKARLSVSKRWNNTNVLLTEYDSNTIKESKVKEKSINTPSLSDVESYFIENGYTKESASKAFYYYQENNWKDSRNQKVKNWKQKMRGVWFKDENKIKNEQLPAHLTRLLN